MAGRLLIKLEDEIYHDVNTMEKEQEVYSTFVSMSRSEEREEVINFCQLYVHGEIICRRMVC